jgi:pimeloyl-ACP methyl ester carboxylesterase
VLCKVNASAVADFREPCELTAEVFFPKEKATAIVFCFPGGACNRHIFDLQVPGDASYSFAQMLTENGYIVIAVDHLGVGDSYRPENVLDVTLERILACNSLLVRELSGNIFAGSLAAEHTPVSPVPVIGLGHSMGAMLAIMQQHRYNDFSALVLMGFSSCGLPDFLSEYGKGFIGNAQLAQQHDVELASAQFGSDYVEIPSVGALGAEANVEKSAIAALLVTNAPLLTIPGALTLVPGCVLIESNAITAPVLLIAGDRDMCEPVREIPSQFSQSADITTVELPDTGHLHFIYASRHYLQEQIGTWLSTQKFTNTISQSYQ